MTDLAQNLRRLSDVNIGGTRDGWTFDVEVWPAQEDPTVRVLMERGVAGDQWTGCLMTNTPYEPGRPGGIRGLVWAYIESLSRPGWLEIKPREAAESLAQSVLHGIVETIEFLPLGPESMEPEEGPRVVSPLAIAADSDRYGIHIATDEHHFSSDELHNEGGVRGFNVMDIEDLDERPLTEFSDWGDRPYPLLFASGAEENDLATMEIMASRGFYSVALGPTLTGMFGTDVPHELRSGFADLESPLEYVESLVLESRDPAPLLVLQDILLSHGFWDHAGFDAVAVPTMRDGKPWPESPPVAAVTVDRGDGYSAYLLAERQSNPATKIERTKARLLAW